MANINTMSIGPASGRGTGSSTAPIYRTTYNNGGSSSNAWQSQIGELVNKMENQAASARAANLSRYDEAKGIYSKIEAMYQPGGAFETAAFGQLEQQKKSDLAYSAQQGVDSGLSQTTRQQYASQRWTEQVGAPATVQIQAQAQQALAGAMGNRAAFIERREDEYPDYAQIAQLMMAANR